MPFQKFLKADAVLCNATARSKKHCLEILSELLVRGTPDIASETIFECLVDRERLGCTGLEDGAAFPHCRIDGIDQSIGALIKLSEPVDFDAADGESVDLVFGLMVPLEIDDSHRAEIRQVMDILSDVSFREKLRETQSSAELFAVVDDAGPLVVESEAVPVVAASSE